MSRDPTVPVNLTTTTPVGPVERTLAATQSTDRVERLRYWRRGGVPPEVGGYLLGSSGLLSSSGELSSG